MQVIHVKIPYLLLLMMLKFFDLAYEDHVLTQNKYMENGNQFIVHLKT